MIINLILLNSFFDFFGFNENILYRNQPQRILLSSNKIWIDKTQFSYLSANHGGAIYFNQNSIIDLLIENCIFFACNSTSNTVSYSGGALCLISTLGNFILNKICSTSCKTPSISGTNTHGQFALIETSSTNKIYIFFSTIYENCPRYYSSNECSQTAIWYGNQIINNLNTSKSELYATPGIQIYLSNSLNMSFSTFSECISRWGIILYFYLGNQRYVYNCNIISNISPSFGVIYNQNANTIIDNCIFKNNSKYLVSNSGTIIIKNSYISHDSNTGFNLGTNNLYITETFLLLHFKTFLCNNIINTKIFPKKIKISFFILLIQFIILK